MAQDHLIRRPHLTEGALTVLFCLVDDAYRILNPETARDATRASRASRTRWS
jgi:hypothetical protein